MVQRPHVCWCEGLVLFEERCDHCYELLEVLTVDEMASMLEAHDLFVGLLCWLLSQRHRPAWPVTRVRCPAGRDPDQREQMPRPVGHTHPQATAARQGEASAVRRPCAPRASGF